VGQIDEIHDAKDEGESGCQQEEQDAELHTIE
jgi:hypothetical protein